MHYRICVGTSNEPQTTPTIPVIVNTSSGIEPTVMSTEG